MSNLYTSSAHGAATETVWTEWIPAAAWPGVDRRGEWELSSGQVLVYSLGGMGYGQSEGATRCNLIIYKIYALFQTPNINWIAYLVFLLTIIEFQDQ